MRILVTGKNGQIGRCLVEQLSTMSDITLLALDRDQLDITDSINVNKVVAEFIPNIIINAAAYTAVDKAEQEREFAYAVNRDGPYNLAVAANNINATIIHISTDYAFAGDSIAAYVETDNTEPQSEYGRSKLAGEQAVERACSRHIILRTGWVFAEHGHNFVNTMLRLTKTRDTLDVVADQFGGPTYAADIANAIIIITKQLANGNQAYGLYHYSGFPYVSWHAFAEKIFELGLAQGILKQSIQVNPITTPDYPTPAKRPANSQLNCHKIKQEFGIVQSDWQAALVRIEEYSR
ncbi:dTDP-4-dehydrorhamnose reductase [Shewanella vesiculosa]|uniref:dTDP-4-dehydrorhamnose reductase n=1 Tax=Shewanella vesiculosa TaxID=518738 RepID=UPI000F4F3275|nr:dTDP-4-dehydrorhamnose reductase [Shewanella vesiculosa]RPA46618.1 dTDP-4-dehydrorhamnose reductase [Shewanella vesiculosa]UJL42936.1 dTDP-4-dehydrorhamnose reductase [Shewanella vesiculosa]